MTLLILTSAVACGGRSVEDAVLSAGTGNLGGAGTGGERVTDTAGGGAASTTTLGAANIGGNGELGPARLAVTAYLSQPAGVADQTSCAAVGTYRVGAPDAPTASDPGEGVPEGGLSSVICMVVKQGSFRFSGMGLTPLGFFIAFENGVIGPDFTGTADVDITLPDLPVGYSSTAPCAITVDNQQLKGGAIWANFSCAQVASQLPSVCALAGTVVFQNCSGS